MVTGGEEIPTTQTGTGCRSVVILLKEIIPDQRATYLELQVDNKNTREGKLAGNEPLHEAMIIFLLLILNRSSCIQHRNTQWGVNNNSFCPYFHHFDFSHILQTRYHPRFIVVQQERAKNKYQPQRNTGIVTRHKALIPPSCMPGNMGGRYAG